VKVLAVIDMQNDFIDGALGTKEAIQIKNRVRAKIERYLADDGTVIYTRDTHEKHYLNTQEGKNLPVLHCVRGTQGWEISKEVFVEGCKVIDKPSFGSLQLAEYVAGLDRVESIELIGLCTDICVISNAMILKARLPEIPVSVDASCCAGVTPESHKNALSAMKMCQIKIIEENIF
jgi:nicotinamidase-related amidase